MIHGRASASGFTFIETLVGLIVLALVMAAAAPLARQAVLSLGKLAREEKRLYAIATAYELFRTSCALTAAPPWVASTSVASLESGRASVAYLGGKLDEAWSMTASDSSIIVEAKGAKIEVEASRARIVRIETDNRIIGLEASFEAMGRTLTWKGYFGAPGY